MHVSIGISPFHSAKHIENRALTWGGSTSKTLSLKVRRIDETACTMLLLPL